MATDMFGKQEAQSPWTSTAKKGTSPLSKAITDLNKATEVVKGLYDRIPWNPKPGGGQESFHEGTKRTLKEGNIKGTAARAALTARSRSERRAEPKGWEKQDVGRGMRNLTKMVRELTTEVEKAYAHAGKPWSQKPGQQGVGRLVHGWRHSEKEERKYHEPQREREAARTIEGNTGQVDKATRQQDVGSHTRRTTIPSTRKQVASHVREHGMPRDQHNYPRDHEIRMEANRGRVANKK